MSTAVCQECDATFDTEGPPHECPPPEPPAKVRFLMSCSFCGKNEDEVKKLIAGPTVYICNECVRLCESLLVKEGV